MSSDLSHHLDTHRGTVALPCCKPIKINALRKSRYYPKDIITFGDHIRAKRLDKGLLQKDVARELSVSIETITNWEKNRNKPTFPMYKRICEFLTYCPYEKPATTLPLKILYMRAYTFGMEHREFAKFAGFNDSTILDWEKGTSKPNIDSLKKLAAICSLNIPYRECEVFNPYKENPNAEPDQPPYKIGSHIYAARARWKMSCRQAAKHLNVHSGNYSEWERNLTIPSARYFPAITEFIGYCPIPPAVSDLIHYLNRVYSNGYTLQQQAALECVCVKSIRKKEQNCWWQSHVQ